MEKEINDLKAQNTWTLVNYSQDKNILKGRWVYKTKLNKDGFIDKYKARWVAKGFQQIYGIDFTETFSNTVKPMVFRALFAIAAHLDLEIQQWDIKSAFPNAKLDQEIYIMQPTGVEDNTNRVCLLNKALYG
ncbi:Reverse transcriptase, RNA-dependent DNA polymerase [Lasallia pustulata]|uniref:Reverse transcriptase, RNA-dependent DNA polymerase n=1 Tax=Lasallia pustulata TaxID=136370 RepID=A0A1W5D2F0_9LECA|nr:Reverse transcriptase, RNA-dependent DNA polymerase [Lasallia pustulata]